MDHVYRHWADRFRGPAGDLTVLTVVALAVFLGNLAIIITGGGPARPIWPGGVALMIVAVAALVWRRAHPIPALAVTATAAAAYYLMGYPAGLEPLPFLVALYGASSHGHRLVSATGAAAAAAVVAVVQLAGTGHVDVRELIGVTGWLTVVLVVAEVVRSRRAYLAAIEERAADAERTREFEAARRVAEERLRIARELHDALAHHISVITIQAGAALLRKESRPELAYEVLPVIKQSAGDAMRELRAALSVLRHPGEEHGSPPAPSPSLDRLAGLVETVRAGGLAVRTVIRGDAGDLPTEVDLAAYRIVQEALTNVARHADAGTATVLISYGENDLEVRVEDDGRGPAEPPAPGGNGLAGMRERAAAIGGVLLAGPRDEGGFRVYARLPLAGAGDPS